MTTHTEAVLDFIPDMAQELPSLVSGEPTTVDRLMLAASVCGWITDLPMHDDREGWPVNTSSAGETSMISALTTGDVFIYKHNPDSDTDHFAIGLADLPVETLADLGRAFINAAIAKHEQERTE